MTQYALSVTVRDAGTGESGTRAVSFTVNAPVKPAAAPVKPAAVPKPSLLSRMAQAVTRLFRR